MEVVVLKQGIMMQDGPACSSIITDMNNLQLRKSGIKRRTTDETTNLDDDHDLYSYNEAAAKDVHAAFPVTEYAWSLASGVGTKQPSVQEDDDTSTIAESDIYTSYDRNSEGDDNDDIIHSIIAKQGCREPVPANISFSTAETAEMEDQSLGLDDSLEEDVPEIVMTEGGVTSNKEIDVDAMWVEDSDAGSEQMGVAVVPTEETLEPMESKHQEAAAAVSHELELTPPAADGNQCGPEPAVKSAPVVEDAEPMESKHQEAAAVVSHELELPAAAAEGNQCEPVPAVKSAPVVEEATSSAEPAPPVVQSTPAVSRSDDEPAATEMSTIDQEAVLVEDYDDDDDDDDEISC